MIKENIKKYIEEDILPRYKKFDQAHQVEHANVVINESLRLARNIGNLDLNMVYVIAAFHDLGLGVDRKTHHLESANIVRNDEFLQSNFTQEEIEIMADAVKDHRASGDTPETIYGKIVSDADRDYDFDNVIVRCIQFRRELDFFSSFREVQLHIREKYRSDGYLKEFYYKQKPSEIQEKFDLFSDDDNFALNEFARIYGPLVFDMNIISFFDRSSVDHGPEFIDRDAVRGVCIKNGKILLVHLEKSGEYKFPGGGVNNGETRHEALRREMLEEAGVSNIMSIKDFGVAIQKQNSNLEDGIFYQKSHYYFVDDFDDNSFCESNLDDYEVDLGMKPKWIDIDEAIINNEEIMLDANRNPWVDRDTLILHLVKEIM